MKHLIGKTVAAGIIFIFITENWVLGNKPAKCDFLCMFILKF